MSAIVNLYSSKPKEIYNFLFKFYNKNICDEESLKYEIYFDNPIEIANIIGVFIDNNDKYNINIWISLDDGFFFNINESNVNKVIRYLYERYPY